MGHFNSVRLSARHNNGTTDDRQAMADRHKVSLAQPSTASDCLDGSNNNDCSLSEHTLSMRHAASFCLDRRNRNPPRIETIEQEDLASLRQSAQKELWARGSIETINCEDAVSADDFRRHFHDRNVPCLVQFSTNGSFSYVNHHWRNVDGKTGKSTPNPDWFAKNLGLETLVPLRFQRRQAEGKGLDDEGRADECETKSVLLREWIDMVKNDAEDRDVPGMSPYYLKDWHLQLLVKEKESLLKDSFYECPPIFQHDLLNAFLLAFTKGDYRFCYWGPKGSYTGRHSDVLHSFSWSYNVVGTKKWTFFEGHVGARERQISIVQHAGEAMFVPSKLQHEVTNLEETISINHNWVTTANLDLCWECLVKEIDAVADELSGWGIQDMEAFESMLRGCSGLDVTSFVLMVLFRFVQLFGGTTSDHRDQPQSDNAMEMSRLVKVLSTIRNDASLQLAGRLEAVLHSKVLSDDLLNMIDRILA